MPPILQSVVAMSLGGMTIITVIDVVGRYFLSAPLTGAGETIEIMLALMITAAVPVISRRNRHISISLIDGLMSASVLTWWKRGVSFLSMIACALIAWGVLQQADQLLLTREHTQVLSLPIWPTAIVVALFWVIAAIAYALNVWRAAPSGDAHAHQVDV